MIANANCKLLALASFDICSVYVLFFTYKGNCKLIPADYFFFQTIINHVKVRCSVLFYGIRFKVTDAR